MAIRYERDDARRRVVVTVQGTFESGDPLAVIEERWRPGIEEGGVSPVALRALPSASRRSARLLGPLTGLVVDG